MASYSYGPNALTGPNTLSMKVGELTTSIADGEGPNLPLPVMYSMVKSIWEQNDDIINTDMDDEFVIVFGLTCKERTKKDSLRFMCMIMCVLNYLDEVELRYTSAPIIDWIRVILMNGWVPSEMVFATITEKLMEQAEAEKKIKLTDAVNYIDFELLRIASRLQPYLRVPFNKVVELSHEIIDGYDNQKGTVSLDEFNECWQGFYEAKLEHEGCGDIVEDAKMLKAMFEAIKLICEATPEEQKKKKRKKKKKKEEFFDCEECEEFVDCV
jgi:hypothetical protein